MRVEIQFHKRLSAPLIDSIVRVTYHEGHTSYEYLWDTPQAKMYTPTFRWTPIYDQLCHDMKMWPIESIEVEHEAEINQKPFWRYDEYVGRHRKEEEEPHDDGDDGDDHPDPELPRRTDGRNQYRRSGKIRTIFPAAPRPLRNRRTAHAVPGP